MFLHSLRLSGHWTELYCKNCWYLDLWYCRNKETTWWEGCGKSPVSRKKIIVSRFLWQFHSRGIVRSLDLCNPCVQGVRSLTLKFVTILDKMSLKTFVLYKTLILKVSCWFCCRNHRIPNSKGFSFFGGVLLSPWCLTQDKKVLCLWRIWYRFCLIVDKRQRGVYWIVTLRTINFF